jgi:tripartite-type tricarboxylate transporter receptor subunit TctC
MHFVRAAAALACAALAFAVHAQTFPTRPVRVIVPFPPGGADITARLLAVKMQEELGKPFIIDTRAGAKGLIGTEATARAAPDGYTLLYTASSTVVANIYLFKSVPYATRDFTPISIVFDAPNVLLAHPSVPANSLKELVDYARNNPGKLTYASSSIGSASHMEMEAFKIAAGLDIVHVPFKGFGPAVQEFLSGRLSLLPIPYFVVKSQIAAGKVKPLAVADSRRYAPLPQIPALTEAAAAFQRAPAWVGVLGPAGMPRPVVARLHDSIVKAVNAPDIRSRFEDDGLLVFANTPEQFADIIKGDVAYVSKMVKTLNIQPE